MFHHIMAPVDLAHLDTLQRALDLAADEARHHGAELTLVSATPTTPGPLAHNPQEFGARLRAFADAFEKERDVEVATHVMTVNDPTTDVDDALLRAIDETGADCVVMASHKPGLGDYFWPSNGGKVASHAGVSVMLVRDP